MTVKSIVFASIVAAAGMIAAGTASAAGPNFGWSVQGPNGGTFSFGFGDVAAPVPPPASAEVCFYKGTNFTGDAFCVDPGEHNPQLIGGWNDAISSIAVSGGAQVTICRNWDYNGGCATISSDKGGISSYNNKVSSFQAF